MISIQPLATHYEWSDLVVDQSTSRQLSDIHECTKSRQSCHALFYGPPGTGKTLAAALLGKQLQQEVYTINLSQVVSKYIGETEKNLGRIFDEAESKNWILFFDEADALFGKRTDVKDSHDKYANQEVSYLLNRIETFNGLAILATNMKNNIDDAFIRRLRFVVYFPIPAPQERLRLWQKGLATHQLSVEPSHLQSIADKYDLSGSAIMQTAEQVSRDTTMRGSGAIIDRLQSKLAGK